MDGIRLYQADALDTGFEPFVSALAEEIVRNSNKTVDRNFLVIREFPVRAIGVVSARRAADVAIIEVIQRRGRERRVVLIIECKVDNRDTRMALAQLTGYMRDTGCEHGIAMSANIALLYRDTGNMLADQVGEEIDLSSDEGVRDVINFINLI
ncbi:hypothetical protein DL89DRAFT_271267, partial [Linderina pennispora]